MTTNATSPSTAKTSPSLKERLASGPTLEDFLAGDGLDKAHGSSSSSEGHSCDSEDPSAIPSSPSKKQQYSLQIL